MLAGRIKLSVDLADSSVRSPHSSDDIGGAGGASVANAAAGGDGSRRGATAGEQGAERAVVGSVLQHVQALRGEVEAESLFELLRTLHALPANAGGWLDSFLELDGMQALRPRAAPGPCHPFFHELRCPSGECLGMLWGTSEYLSEYLGVEYLRLHLSTLGLPLVATR